MRKPSPKRRVLHLALVVAMLCPDPALARVVPDINLGTIKVHIKPRLDACTPGTGTVTYQAPAGPLEQASPGIDPAPSFHSGNTDLSVWGLGWTSDIDHRITINGNNTITWTNGQGVHVTYFQAPGSTTTPVYTPPVNAYETITTVAVASGVPTSLLERDLDGTTRRFDAFESTGVLRLALLTDKNANTVAYTRDALGRLTRVQDVHGRFFNLTYDAAGLVATLSDSGGRSSSYAYDAAKRRTGDTGPLGTTAYQYDAAGRMTKITYPNGGVKNYTYDALNRVLTEDDGAGVNAQGYVYYKSSTTVTDALGRVVKYDYITLKGLKKIAKITDPSGGVTSFVYDANLNLTSQTDPLGRVTAYTYDAKGNVTATDDPAGGRTLASYEPNFNLVASLTDPLARTTNMTYDAQGNLTVVTDALSGTVNKGYDGQGHVTQSRDPLGHSTLFSYEPTNGALKTITDPLTRQTVMLTDGLSRVTRNTDPSGKVTEYTYDAASNLTQVKDALGGLTRYAYAPGRDKKLLATVTDAKGNATTFGYDAQGRLTSVTNALGQTKTSTYDGKGNLIQTKNARNQVISYAYDSRDRLVTKTMPEGVITFAYDAAGNQTDTQHYNGSRVQTTYDALNRVTQAIQTLPGGYAATIGYGYDANGNRTSMTTPWGSFGYLYDSLNRLTRITNPQSRQFNFQYDANGRRTKLIYPNGIETTYVYDNAGQVLSIIHTSASNGVIAAKSTYSYDASGNRTSMGDLSGTHTYAYDSLRRLTVATHPIASKLPLVAETFSYDALGNRLADAQVNGYTYDNANRIIENSSYTYTYDADGNRVLQASKFSSEQIGLNFNSDNQLVGALSPDGTWEYKYDGQGKRVEVSSGAASSQISRYFYDGPNILAAIGGNNNLERIFTMSIGIDDLLGAHSPNSTDKVFHLDALGSVQAVTSPNASVAESYEYLSHGETVIKDSSGNISTDSIMGASVFTAGLLDTKTRLYQKRNRSYDPALGTFVSVDPLGLSGGVNGYTFVNNNPIRWIDPMGLARCTYSISAHTLVCWPGDPNHVGQPVVIGPDGLFSGDGLCRNQTSCINDNSLGPIVPGNYNMNPDTRPKNKGKDYWRLEPNPKIPGWQCKAEIKRCGFMLHPGEQSLGCVTTDIFNLKAMQQYRRVNELLQSETGSNTLSVIP